MKRFFSITMVITIVFSLMFTCTAWANPDAKQSIDNMNIKEEASKHLRPVETVTINEYEVYKELKNTKPDKLKEAGYKDADIEYIKNFDFAAEIDKRKNLSDDELINIGYTDEQIEILRSFGGSEEEMIALAAACEISSGIFSFFYNEDSNKTIAGFSLDWNWTSRPTFCRTDVVGFAWSEGMYLDKASTASDVHYVYTLDETMDVTIQESVKAATGACQFNIPMWNTSDNRYWAESGSAYVYATKVGELPEIGLVCKYGHSTVTASPSIQYSLIPLSLSFTNGVTEYADGDGYYHEYL